MFRLGDDRVLRSDLFSDLEWMTHGFGTRQALHWPGETTTLKQIHSGDVFEVRGPRSGELGEGDALLTAAPGTTLSIRTADCVPILLADPNRRVVAAIHAGWRGTARSIVRSAMARMSSVYGCGANEVRAAIGPAIGACCYEVSEDVALQFREHLPPSWNGGKVNIDLAAINRSQLLGAGLSAMNIDAPSFCTRCDAAGRFHSFRRDGEASGRMHAVVGVRAALVKSVS